MSLPEQIAELKEIFNAAIDEWTSEAKAHLDDDPSVLASLRDKEYPQIEVIAQSWKDGFNARLTTVLSTLAQLTEERDEARRHLNDPKYLYAGAPIQRVAIEVRNEEIKRYLDVLWAAWLLLTDSNGEGYGDDACRFIPKLKEVLAELATLRTERDALQAALIKAEDVCLSRPATSRGTITECRVCHAERDDEQSLIHRVGCPFALLSHTE